LVRSHQCYDDNTDDVARVDEVVNDNDDVILIELCELMKFSKVQQACNDDIELLRSVFTFVRVYRWRFIQLSSMYAGLR